MLTFIDLMLLSFVLILMIEIIDQRELLLILAFITILIVGTLQSNFTFSGNEAYYSYTVLLGIELMTWKRILSGGATW